MTKKERGFKMGGAQVKSKVMHLDFREIDNLGRKTRYFQVWNPMYQVYLGTITWYAHWRKYCFNSAHCTFDINCLHVIQLKLEELNLEHKRLRNASKKAD